MNELTILIKPASSLCNMRCRYCFYFDVSSHREIDSYGIMEKTVMLEVIKKAFEQSNPSGIIHFIFQGGEPTLVGLSYYKAFVKEVKKYQKNQRVSYSIQTNGILLDESWYRLFKDNNFLVGLSIDGFKENMDIYRLDNQYKPVFNQVLNTIKQLTKYNIQYNVLTVVTSNLSRSAKKLYTFYQKYNIRYVQLIPCLPPLNKGADEHSLKPSQYRKFYVELFRLWKQDVSTSKYIDINTFTNIFTLLNNKNPYQCGIVGNCSTQIIIEANGDVFPCDFYVTEENKLGSILDNTYQELLYSPEAKRFLCNKVKIKEICKSCRYLKICNGGCKRQNTTFLGDTVCGYQGLLDEIFKYIESSY